jgi:hypothetical protein
LVEFVLHPLADLPVVQRYFLACERQLVRKLEGAEKKSFPLSLDLRKNNEPVFELRPRFHVRGRLSIAVS